MSTRGLVKGGTVQLEPGHALPEGAAVQVLTASEAKLRDPAERATENELRSFNEQLLREVKARLSREYGPRLKGVVLYGSQARGDYGPDSDIDLLVLLKGPIDLAGDLQTNIRALYPLTLDLGRPISAQPVDAWEYETVACPLYEAAHEEGIIA